MKFKVRREVIIEAESKEALEEVLQRGWKIVEEGKGRCRFHLDKQKGYVKERKSEGDGND